MVRRAHSFRVGTVLRGCLLAEPGPDPGQWTFDREDDKGGKDRATVALVSAQLTGVERLIDAGFKDMQRQLDSVAGLPERVTRLEEQMGAFRGSVAAEGAQRAEVRMWRRGLVTAACLMLLGTLVNLAISGHIF